MVSPHSEDIRRQPTFNLDDAAQILRDHFGIEGNVSELPSERDQNFKIESAFGDYVLKIANPEADVRFLELENQAIRLVQAADGFHSAQISKSTTGQSIVNIGDGPTWQAQLPEFRAWNSAGEDQKPARRSAIGNWPGIGNTRSNSICASIMFRQPNETSPGILNTHRKSLPIRLTKLMTRKNNNGWSYFSAIIVKLKHRSENCRSRLFTTMSTITTSWSIRTSWVILSWALLTLETCCFQRRSTIWPFAWLTSCWTSPLLSKPPPGSSLAITPYATSANRSCLFSFRWCVCDFAKASAWRLNRSGCGQPTITWRFPKFRLGATRSAG